MRQAVATMSMWGERHFGYSTLRNTTDMLAEEQWPQMPRLKEDCVIEEKEVEEDGTAVPGVEDSRCERGLEEQGKPTISKLPLAHRLEKEAAPSVTGGTSKSPDNDQQAAPAPPGSSLGEVAPVWVPDSQAPTCMKCGAKFTFTKRRHHCRACGKVFCVVCCDLRCTLTHLDGKEGRVCVSCHSTLVNKALCRGQRKVWFTDNILPNNDATDTGGTPSQRPADPSQPNRPLPLGMGEEVDPPSGWGVGDVVGNPISSSANLIPVDGLPPILTSTGVKGDYTVEERPSETSLLTELEGGRADPLVFVLNANLLAIVKLINYVNRRCWYVMSKGMHAVGQAEVVVLLQCLPDEKGFPRDIFSHFIQLYQDALTGKVLSHLGHSLVDRGLLGSKEHAGFLYIQPTFQSMEGLPLPSQPFLFGLLIQRAETPWARSFPLRLMLRLGAEYRFYPCPLFSVRFRKPLFGDTSQTIMRLLVDFRFYRYTLPVVTGLMVDMEARSTCIKIPRARHNELMKALNKSNEHVLAMGACFNEHADSHLICVQTDSGQYQTQAISIHNKPRRAKSKRILSYNLQESVHLHWLDQESHFNKGITSPIDGKSMESITSIKRFQRLEYKANGKVIRWTEVFFLQREMQPSLSNYTRLTERLARAFCLALCPYLKLLKEDGMVKLGLRIILDSQQADYLAGSNGQPLPSQYLQTMDSSLIPVIQAGSHQKGDGHLEMELVFYIQENIT
uniref:FYVE-type domain-containing protein n=1 Tax=Denticeps clupeoides TaxID=299321 RepID=A0AAY4DUY4_9TELE